MLCSQFNTADNYCKVHNISSATVKLRRNSVVAAVELTVNNSISIWSVDLDSLRGKTKGTASQYREALENEIGEKEDITDIGIREKEPVSPETQETTKSIRNILIQDKLVEATEEDSSNQFSKDFLF